MGEYRTELKLRMFTGNDVEEGVEKARDCIEEIKDEQRQDSYVKTYRIWHMKT